MSSTENLTHFFLQQELEAELPFLPLENFSFFDGEKPPAGVISALKRKNEFIRLYDYGEHVKDRRQYVLRLSQACPCNCSYCYIKSAYPQTPPVFFYNISDLKKEIVQILKKDKNPYFNAGENSDSFAFDSVSQQSLVLRSLASEFSSSVFEMRTKVPSRACRRFLELPSVKNLVIAVSLNPERIIRKFEHGTDSLKERIAAMRVFLDMGYSVSIRLDPVIDTPEFESDYSGLLSLLCSSFGRNEISDIEAGCLRLTKEQHRVLKNRQEKPGFLFSEFSSGPDRKLRYHISRRIEIYRFILPLLSNFSCCIRLSNENEKCQKLSGLKLSSETGNMFLYS